jgi:hypothetical protein
MKKQKTTFEQYQSMTLEQKNALPMTVQKKFIKEACIKNLKQCFEDAIKDSQGNPIVYTSITSVSKSGMSRKMKVYISTSDGIEQITYWTAKALGWSLNEKGITVTGCGMDMGFHLVYCLGYAVLGKDYKVSQRWI